MEMKDTTYDFFCTQKQVLKWLTSVYLCVFDVLPRGTCQLTKSMNN